MAYSRKNPLAAYLLRRRIEPLDQVANARDEHATVNLTPASEAPAERVRAAWKPTLPGQAIPMIGERTYAEPDYDR